ncbi:hypothetical protein [Geodermatophilus maliterrae]|uniref:Uncharacterized protein n=1 Tax=Geodermatophilus maliterrae TaxID=3162531 RepID=A0ABV3XF86_9ACTN
MSSIVVLAALVGRRLRVGLALDQVGDALDDIGAADDGRVARRRSGPARG